MPLKSINPATGETLSIHPERTPDEALAILAEIHDAFLAWRRCSFEERSRPLRKAASLLRERRKDYAILMAREMGKPITQGAGEIEKCAWACEFYAENAARFLSSEQISTEASRSFVSFQPLGIVLAVMPWNFPFWQVFRFAAPALMAGNAAVLKHASNVSGCALAIEKLLEDAGFPKNLFRTLLISSANVGAVIAHPKVQAVTLTGSTEAGKSIAAQAGAALKKTVLELGGSDPYLILEDADLEKAAESCVTSRLINSGQSCIAAKRFIVVESVREEFENLFVRKMAAAKVGDPLDPTTQVGPLARRDLRDELDLQVRRSEELGAQVIFGGLVPDGPGAYYPPTVLANVTRGMPAHEEELFGPVAAIISARDEEHAIQIANQSPFGLGAAVFTSNKERGERIAALELEAGCCFVNDYVKSDPRLPFGGIKQSGYGRELAAYGIKEFVNIKSVVVK